ncbi:hypothetical protein PMIN07_006801 [Paraphaeosphaeria minitans]
MNSHHCLKSLSLLLNEYACDSKLGCTNPPERRDEDIQTPWSVSSSSDESERHTCVSHRELGVIDTVISRSSKYLRPVSPSLRSSPPTDYPALFLTSATARHQEWIVCQLFASNAGRIKIPAIARLLGLRLDS